MKNNAGRFLRAGVILGSYAAALAACSDGATPPAGDIQIESARDEFVMGDAVKLRWNAANVNRVYVQVIVDDKQAMMLDDSGFDPVGESIFRIDEATLAFDRDDELDIKFALLARDVNRTDRFITIDTSRTIEVITRETFEDR